MKINSICIVGGGSSGWMTAAALSKNFPNIDFTLVESDINPVGVGESTLGSFNRFLRYLGLEDKDWMPHCNATYKTSIAFKNFREGNGERFQYPFGDYVTEYDTNFIYYLRHHYPEFYPPEEAARFINFQTFLAESNRFTNDGIEGTTYNSKKNVAYHFDAALFGKFLKEKIAIPNGVKYFNDKISYCTKDEKGNIKALHTDKGNSFTADLFIDCTGFKSLLLGKFMGVPFKDYSDWLFNDTALATQIPYIEKNEQMRSWTDCIAMSNGWVWEIPLWNRIGTGYVFSSKYITPEDAEVEYRDFLSKQHSKEIADKAKFKLIKIRHGRHDNAWEKNVVGVGLSYGFIEPLESTGLMTTHENILTLGDILSNINNNVVGQKDRDLLNYYINSLTDSMMVFVNMHYYLSSRSDNLYWEDCINNKSFFEKKDRFNTKLEYQIDDFLELGGAKWFNSSKAGDITIALGQGINPVTKRIYNEAIEDDNFLSDLEATHEKYQKMKKELLERLDLLPTHFEYLKNNIYGGYS